MKYLHQIVKAHEGTVVTVNFDKPAKVMLLHNFDYIKYEKHHTYKYMGGHTEKSPAVFSIPADGTWHVVIELGSYFTPIKINASVETTITK
ncbi:MAG TPA: DUF1883 domain-containing protein [Bacteroidia bacterium]|nr:DUF1883 domain-containing protein [Bacteroidia bacterium]